MLTRVGGVLRRLARVLSAKMPKSGKGKAAATSDESWYDKQKEAREPRLLGEARQGGERGTRCKEGGDDDCGCSCAGAGTDGN